MDASIERQLADLVRAGGQEPKGMLYPHILVPENALNNGADLVQATVDFVNWALSDGQFLPSEFPSEAFCAYYADYYLAQVNNGGHSQWAGNSGFNPLVVKSAGWALEAMGAQDYHAIYRDFLRLMDKPEAAAKIMASGGFGERVPEEDALNTRFYALDTDFSYPMLTISGNWLRGLPCLKVLAPDALAAAREAAASSNPYRAERLQSAQREQEKKILYWMPRKLCADAKLMFGGLTAGNPVMIDGKRRFAWYMQTDQGLMLAAFFKASMFSGATARLYRANSALQPDGRALAEVSISKADYAAAVPRQWE